MGRVVEPIARDRYNETFKQVASTLRDAEIPFACMGSLALWALGGPEPNLQQDLDFAIHEGDVEAAKAALAGAGLDIQQPPEDWLFKAWNGGVEQPGAALVDLIFRPSGLVISRERLATCEQRSVLAMTVPVISATDLLVTKLHSLTEQCADFSSTLQFARSLREQIDRAELETRVADTAFGGAFLVLVDALGIAPDGEGAVHVGRGGSRAAPMTRRLDEEPAASFAARLEQRIHEDARGATLDLHVEQVEDGILLSGEVTSTQHRSELLRVARELAPGLPVHDELEVRDFAAPREAAEVIG